MTPTANIEKWHSAWFGLALGCLLFVSAPRCEAQNLVPNPGFEETDTCQAILGLGGIHDWYSAYLTPDHLQSCLPYGSVNGLPLNFVTFQHAFDGNACAGILTYLEITGEEQREWLIVPLLQPMVPGQTYYCSMRANAAFGGNEQYPQIWLANSHVGMLFTTYDRHWYWGDPYPEPLNTAQVFYPQVLTDTVGWTLVSGSFVADSAYTYLMIGNFFSNTLTDTMHFADPSSVFPWYPRGYTLIDGVCVSANPNDCDMGQSVEEQEADLMVVYPNPARDVFSVRNGNGVQARVRDALGRLVWQGTVQGDDWGLQVAEWSRGSYVLQLERATERLNFKFVLID